jgi:shikimate kinase
LIGLRCSGKTCVGRELARRIGVPFVDLDDEVGRLNAATRRSPTRDALARDPHSGAPHPHDVEASPSAGEVLAEVGETAFRDLEMRALRATVERTGPFVLATGGGVVESADARTLLARIATCVWLRVGIVELQRRLRSDPTPRPSLTGGDPSDELPLLAARRDPLYAGIAHITVDGRGKGVEEMAVEIAFKLGKGTRRGCRA